jgi:hypothetical protein
MKIRPALKKFLRKHYAEFRENPTQYLGPNITSYTDVPGLHIRRFFQLLKEEIIKYSVQSNYIIIIIIIITT